MEAKFAIFANTVPKVTVVATLHAERDELTPQLRGLRAMIEGIGAQLKDLKKVDDVFVYVFWNHWFRADRTNFKPPEPWRVAQKYPW